ncbi:hypothetical protein [Microbacterium sp. 22296]|uniref:hypothetical protein n=1 Tax=Microbacterium sp. 22296 TaxID=3453903 RepID=UPI003F850883
MTLDDCGTLVVSHPAHLGFVLVDPHPVAAETTAGPRRPASRLLQADAAGDVWRIDDGDVERVVEFLPSGVRVTATSRSSSDVVAFPWMGLRAARLALSLDGIEVRAAHAVRGRWPIDLVDFEACADGTSSWPAGGAEIVWDDGLSGIAVTATRLRGRTARLEGWHLVRLSGGGTVGYDLALTAPERSAAVHAEHGGRVVDTWRRSRRALVDVIQSTTDVGTLTVAPRAGLVEWSRDARPIVSSPFPSRRAIGPLTTASTALWACVEPDRSDLDQGAVWPTDDNRLAFRPDGSSEDAGWSLMSFDSPTELGVRVSATAEGRRLEAVVFIALAKATRVRIADSAGGVLDLDVSPEPWRTWTYAASFFLEDGWLHLTPVRGAHPEILIRSTAQGLMIAAYSRLSSESTETVWRLRWDAP